MADQGKNPTGKKPAGRKPAGSVKPPTMSKKEIQLAKKVRDLEEKLEEANKETPVEETKAEVKSAPAEEVKIPSVQDERQSAEINDLRAQLELLSNQIMKQQSLLDPSKARYKPVPPSDFQDEGVTFSSRRVFLIIGSYLDKKGVEVMPPYKLFKLQYAASDIRKDGMEDSIVNFCEFTSHLKAEIKFLRDHPLYGIEFFENLNETMASDSRHSEFRIRAAQQVASMSDEAVIQAGHQFRIPRITQMSVRTIRPILVSVLGDKYIQAAKDLEDEQVRKRALAGQDV